MLTSSDYWRKNIIKDLFTSVALKNSQTDWLYNVIYGNKEEKRLLDY